LKKQKAGGNSGFLYSAILFAYAQGLLFYGEQRSKFSVRWA